VSHNHSHSQNSSGRERSGSGSRNPYEKSNSLYLKKSTLGLPSSPKRGYLRPQTLPDQSEGRILRRIQGERGYNIKVRAAEASEESKEGSQDEGSPCSVKYEGLEENKYRFPVIKRGLIATRIVEKGQSVAGTPVFAMNREILSKYNRKTFFESNSNLF